MAHAPTQLDARCPRCGYDQRGVIESWRDSCPLRGTCSECGLAYFWAALLHPGKYEPQWCVEFAHGVRRIIHRCLTTFRRSFRPWRFWSEISMSAPIRARRLACYIAFLFLPFLLPYIVIQSSAALYVYVNVRSAAADQYATNSQRLANAQATLTAGVTPAGLPLDSEIIFRLQQDVASLQAVLANGQSLTISPIQAVGEALFLPTSGVSAGRVPLYSRLRPYIAPVDLHRSVRGIRRNGPVGWRAFWPSRAREEYAGLITTAAVWFAVGVGGLLLYPLLFLLLPQTRRRARVQWRHIGRVTAYSAAIPAFLLWAVFLLVGHGLWLDRDFDDTLVRVVIFQQLAPWVLLAFWWSWAIRRYLQMPHPVTLTILLSVVSFLSILILIWLVDASVFASGFLSIFLNL